MLPRLARRRRRRQRGKLWGRVRMLLLVVCGAGVLAFTGFFAGFAYTYMQVGQSLPDLDDFRSVELAQTSLIYDASGNVVDQLYGVQNRFTVPKNEIDGTLKDAVVAIEDHRFYRHRGLDFEAIARAAQQNLVTLSIQEGGSTITQQLIKNTYIAQEQRFVPSFQRKLNEAALAWQYEKEHSKQEILAQYLNTVYFGQNAYGAEAAARTYFDKSAAELTLPESAMIAGIINLPGLYDPFLAPASAKARRDVVLDKMLQYGHITKAEHEAAVSQDLGLSRGSIHYEADNEYFLDAVRQELAEEYGDEAIYEGGLRIHTTLDPELQDMATSAVDSTVNPENGDPSASLVSVEPGTGAVRALVGGSDFGRVKFNLATQAHRQPGSSFKPFVLAEAIDQNISPTQTRYVSKNLTIPMPPGSGQPYYHVGNYGGAQRGPITLEEALAQSDNTVFMQLALDLGMENVVEMAHDMGIESPLETYPSTAIGGLGLGVTPLEMASSYGTFANEGVHMEPFLIERVTKKENGHEVLIEQHDLEGQEALSNDEAAVATQALRSVLERGTASYYHDVDAEIGRPSAGKTGTTDNFVDAWYTGFIPQLSTSIWVGYPDEQKSMVNINGLRRVNGENYPLDIWSAYMQQAVSEFPTVERFPSVPPDIGLEMKTDGRAYAPLLPPEPPEPEKEKPYEEDSEEKKPPEKDAPPEDTPPEETTPEGAVRGVAAPLPPAGGR